MPKEGGVERAQRGLLFHVPGVIADVVERPHWSAGTGRYARSPRESDASGWSSQAATFRKVSGR